MFTSCWDLQSRWTHRFFCWFVFAGFLSHNLGRFLPDFFILGMSFCRVKGGTDKWPRSAYRLCFCFRTINSRFFVNIKGTLFQWGICQTSLNSDTVCHAMYKFGTNHFLLKSVQDLKTFVSFCDYLTHLINEQRVRTIKDDGYLNTCYVFIRSNDFEGWIKILA